MRSGGGGGDHARRVRDRAHARVRHILGAGGRAAGLCRGGGRRRPPAGSACNAVRVFYCRAWSKARRRRSPARVVQKPMRMSCCWGFVEAQGGRNVLLEVCQRTCERVLLAARLGSGYVCRPDLRRSECHPVSCIAVLHARNQQEPWMSKCTLLSTTRMCLGSKNQPGTSSV